MEPWVAEPRTDNLRSDAWWSDFDPSPYGRGSIPMGSHFGAFGASPILEHILVVGLNRMFTGG